MTGTGFASDASLLIDGIEASGRDGRERLGHHGGRHRAARTSTRSTSRWSIPGSEPIVLDNAFVYVAPEVKRITGINPPTGSQRGGEAVIIKGVDFVEGVVVSFFGRPATDVVVLDPSTLRVTTPAGPLGRVSVNVRNPGEETYTDRNGFRYVDRPPRVGRCRAPDQGRPVGGHEGDHHGLRIRGRCHRDLRQERGAKGERRQQHADHGDHAPGPVGASSRRGEESRTACRRPRRCLHLRCRPHDHRRQAGARARSTAARRSPSPAPDSARTRSWESAT